MVHTRATDTPLVDFDSEIDRTFHRNHREHSTPQAAMGDQTLRQLTLPNLTQQHLAVNIPAVGDGVNF